MKKQLLIFLSFCAGLLSTGLLAQEAQLMQPETSSNSAQDETIKKDGAGSLKNACNGVPAPDIVLEITGDYFQSQYTPDESGNGLIDVYIKNPAGQTTVKRPLIFVEGLNFDEPQDLQPFKNGELGWCALWGADPDFARLSKMPELLNAVLARGYSVVMVDLGSGTDFIEKNGMALAKFLEQLYGHQLYSNGQAVADQDLQPAVMVGASMGGLIGRYAIGYLNEQDKNSNVRFYVSFDTPHLGGIVPPSVQKMFYDLGVNGPPLMGARFRETALQFCRPALRELLMFHVPDSRPGYERTLFSVIQRNEFVSRLNSMGWKDNILNAAVINGSRIGTQVGQPGQQLFKWDVPLNCAGTDVLSLDIKRAVSPSDISIELEYFDEDFYTPQIPGLGFFSCFSGFSDDFHSNGYNDGSLFMHAYSAGGMNPLFKKLDDETGDFLDGNPVLATEYQDGFTMVPVYSGIAEPNLGINTPLTAYSGINHQFENNPQIRTTRPFDFVFAPLTNEHHVFVHEIGNDFFDYTGRNSRFLLNKVIGSENPVERIGGSLSTRYNLCRMESRMFGSCIIENGGEYQVNNAGMADFGTHTPAGYPSEYDVYSTMHPYFSDYVARSCDCDSVTIEVKSGGVYRIGDPVDNLKANVIFERGSKLILRSGSLLEINNGSVLDITEHAEIIIESGAQIVMNNPASKLIIRNHNKPLAIGSSAGVVSISGVNGLQGGVVSIEGQSVLKSDVELRLDKSTVIEWNRMSVEQNADIRLLGGEAFLWFQGDSSQLYVKQNVNLHIRPDSSIYAGEHGRLIFGNNQFEKSSIQGEPGSSLTLEGSNSYNAIAEIRGQRVTVEDGLDMFRLMNGSVLNNSSLSDPALTNIGTMLVYSDFKAEDVRFVGVSQGALPQDGLHIIRNLSRGCIISNCNFSGFRKGIMGSSVYIRALVNMTNCTFQNCKQAGSFAGMTNARLVEGTVSGCYEGFNFHTISGWNIVNQFVMNGTGSGVAIRNLSEDSRLSLIGNTITNFTNGLRSTGRMLNPLMKCNRITNCEVGVFSARMNMSTDQMAGYNYIGENHISNIELELPDAPSWVILNHGHNTLTMNQSGTVNIDPIECEDCISIQGAAFEPIMTNELKSINGYVSSDFVTGQVTIPAVNNNWINNSTSFINALVNNVQYPRSTELFGMQCPQATMSSQGFGVCLYSSSFGRVNFIDDTPIIDETQQCSTMVGGSSGQAYYYMDFLADAPEVSFFDGSGVIQINLSVLLNDIHERYRDYSTPKSKTKRDLELLAELDFLWMDAPKDEQDKLLKDKITELYYLLLERAIENDQINNPGSEAERIDLTFLERKKEQALGAVDQTLVGGQIEKVRMGVSQSTLAALSGRFSASAKLMEGIEIYLTNLETGSGKPYQNSAKIRHCLLNILDRVACGLLAVEDIPFELSECNTGLSGSRNGLVEKKTGISTLPSNAIFPNPATTTATLMVKGAFVGGTVTLVSMDGKIQWQQALSGETLQLNTENLAKGIYQLVLRSETGSVETLRWAVNN